MSRERQLYLPINAQEKIEEQENKIKKLKKEKQKLKKVVREVLVQEITHIARRKGETPTRKEFGELSLTKNTEGLISICFNSFKELVWEAELPPRQKKKKKK